MTNTEDIINNPVSWVLGGITSVVGVIVAVGVDPVSTSAAFADVLIVHATSAFTAASIAGFTIAPEVSWIPEGGVKAVALLFGTIVVGKMASRLWGAFTDRIGGE